MNPYLAVTPAGPTAVVLHGRHGRILLDHAVLYDVANLLCDHADTLTEIYESES